MIDIHNKRYQRKIRRRIKKHIKKGGILRLKKGGILRLNLLNGKAKHFKEKE